MHRTLGTLALLLGLAACGSETTPDADILHAPPPVEQVALLSGTAAGGEVTSTPTRLPDDAAAQEYAARFGAAGLRGEIVAAVKRAEVPDGRQLAAAVVAVGCDVPPRVVGTGSGDDVGVRAALPSPNTKQCFAPITTVALVLLPEQEVG